MRRAGAIVTPSGAWCAGVTTTAGLVNRSTRSPSPSTGTPAIRCPVPAANLRNRSIDGSSNAISSMPRSASACPSTVMAWVNPATITIRAGSASTPRLRPRYAASVARSTSEPRGSP